MIRKFKFGNSEEIVELESEEVKHNKNTEVKGHFNIFKTPKGYVLSFGIKNVNYVFNQSKLLKDLDLVVPEEDELYMKLMCDYHDSCNIEWDVPKCYRFEVGEEIEFGCGVQATIVCRSDNYNHYRVRCKKEGDFFFTYTTLDWRSCFKKSIAEPINSEEIPVYFYNTTLSTIFGKLFHFGLDLNPSYQRGNVWTDEQKVNLIDSLFHHAPCFQAVLAEKKWIDGDNVS